MGLTAYFLFLILYLVYTYPVYTLFFSRISISFSPAKSSLGASCYFAIFYSFARFYRSYSLTHRCSRSFLFGFLFFSWGHYIL